MYLMIGEIFCLWYVEAWKEARVRGTMGDTIAIA